MTAEEFWEKDPQLFVSYRTSFINKKKREMEELDYKCWLQGLYNTKANFYSEEILRNTIINMFSDKKTNNNVEPYPKRPLTELSKETKKDNFDNKKEKYDNFQNSLCYFGSIKQQYLNNIKKEVM